jgi:hypothetical protein
MKGVAAGVRAIEQTPAGNAPDSALRYLGSNCNAAELMQ